MKQSHLIAKNMFVVVSSQLLSFGLVFVVIALIARHLGTIGFGEYSFILAFTGAFQLLAEFGLGNIMTREIAVNKENLGYHLGVTKSLIWILSIIVFMLIYLTIKYHSPWSGRLGRQST